MVTLTTEYGEFSAESEDEVLRASRKAKREHERAEAARKIAYEQACVNAKLEAYRVYDLKAEHETRGMDELFPRGWRLLVPGNPYFPEVEVRGHNHWSIKLETDEGYAVLDLWYLQPLAVVENGAGIHFLLFVRHALDHALQNEPARAYAIGSHDGQAAMAIVYGVTMEQFHQSKNNE